jgi:hypothetical protein
MEFPSALFRFTNIPDGAIRSGELAFGVGAQPSIASIEVLPNDKISPGIGELQIVYSGPNPVTLKFPGCALLAGRTEYTVNGATFWRIRIADRRWSWKHSHISGKYNARDGNGDLDKKTYLERSPQDLARLLLAALGETAFDVFSLPNDSRPAVDWDEARADVELERLCESLGCRLVLGLDNKPRIHKLGIGKNLPADGAATNASVGYERSAIPGKIRVVFAPTVFQDKIKLKAVGEETDGKIEPIDDLSYKPVDGWGHPGDLEDDEEKYTDYGGVEHFVRDLAEKTVYRFYQIESLCGLPEGTWTPKGRPLIEGTIQQVFLNDVLIDSATDPSGTRKQIPAYVEGEYSDDELDTESFMTEPGTRWRGSVSIDSERRIVSVSGDDEFGAYTTSDDDGSEIGPAELYLVTTYTLRDKTGAVVRHSVEKEISKNPGVLAIRADHLALTVRQRYTGPTARGEVTTNLNLVDPEAERLIKAEQEKLKPQRADDLEWAGIRSDVVPDGAISQVTWSVGPSGIFTRAGRNTEPSTAAVPYEEKRRRERAESDAAFGAARSLFESFTTFGGKALETAKKLLPFS